ncbi:hypothetical protein O181_008512 [Austropuccinia psidii MF-1]|uniref:Uncharacterized protein n=1 Tax=Austropuccinia psidii MF-1 TaxID=1389203 RepID=A0A9Q3BPW3_9BASI|nr:hypothetical protein [Austropuccinia psidii MF-1]
MLTCAHCTHEVTLKPPHQSLHSCTPTAYNPYTHVEPSRYASNASLNPPYTFSHPPLTTLVLLECPPDIPLTLLPHRPNPQHRLPSLGSCSTLKMRL